jgi:hypothetical protein
VVPNLAAFYGREERRPDAATSHYGDLVLAAALWHDRGGPRFTFTAHSLGAQKLERLMIYNHTDIEQLDRELHFARRIAAERVAMSHAARAITSTRQERREQYAHVTYQGAIDSSEKNHIGLVLAFAHSSELQDSANLLLVVPGLEELRPGMELGMKAEPVLREIAAACERASSPLRPPRLVRALWARPAGVGRGGTPCLRHPLRRTERELLR